MGPSTVFIHAGLHKTGTTSIQGMLARHCAELQSAGYSVWQISENHSIPLRLWLEQGFSNRQRRRRAFGSAEEIKDSLRRGLAASSSNFVISGEGLSKQPPPALATLAQFLTGESGGAEVKVVLYVRRLDRHLSSYVQQKLKRGSTLGDALADIKIFHYRERIGDLFEVFGRSQVDVRRCPEVDEAGPKALLVDFLEAIGAPIEPEQESPKNSGLSEKAVRLLDLINSATGEGNLKGRWRWLVQDLRVLLPGPSYRIPSEVLGEIAIRYADDIAWLKDISGIDVMQFPPEVPRPGIEIDRDLAMVVFRLAERVSEATAKARYQAASQKLARGETAAAKAQFEEALLAFPGHQPSRAALQQLQSGAPRGSA